MIFNYTIIPPMKNTLNKIIIPKKWLESFASTKSKEEILKNLNGISSEDINKIWESITESKDKDINSEASIQESNIEESTNQESNKEAWEKNSKEYSEETAGIIDEEVKKIIDKAYMAATELLRTHIDKLHTVAGILLEKEKIDGDEFDEIFAE